MGVSSGTDGDGFGNESDGETEIRGEDAVGVGDTEGKEEADIANTTPGEPKGCHPRATYNTSVVGLYAIPLEPPR
jgi:hypothetical protein